MVVVFLPPLFYDGSIVSHPRRGAARLALPSARRSKAMPAKTVLVVDDDPDIVGALRTALECAGYRVLTAADGDAGLAAAEREAPDLVVVDMMMPKRSGFLVLEKLKA